MKRLRLHLCPLAELGAESVLDYEVLDTARAVLDRGRAVPAALPRLPRTELVLAAPDVLLIEATLPPLSGSRLRAALPALAEPHVLAEIGTAFVVAAHPGGGPTTLAVVDRALLPRSLELLRRVKLSAASATPEQLTLPLAPGRWRLRLGGAYACLRMAPLRGSVCSVPLEGAPPIELRLALEQAGDARPEAIEVEGACDVDAWSRSLGVAVIATEAPEKRAQPVVLELLQYEFAPRISLASWRVPAVLAALIAATWLVGLNVEAWLMRREEQALRAQMAAAVREVMPSVPVILDAPAQMRRAVADLRTGAGSSDPREFLPLATALARALPPDPDAVRTLDFRDGTLRVDFAPRALGEPKRRDAVLEQLGAAGLAARFSDATLSVRPKEGS